MRYVNGFIGLTLVTFAIVERQSVGEGVLFSVGAALAFVTLKKHWFSRASVNALAVATTLVMFAYFTVFFDLAPSLQADWYWREHALHAGSLLFSAFAMIPVLAEFSCRMKAGKDCIKAIRSKDDKHIIETMGKSPRTTF